MTDTLESLEDELDESLPALLPLVELLGAAAGNRPLADDRMTRLRELGLNFATISPPAGLGLGPEGVARLAMLGGRHLVPSYLMAEAFLLAPALDAAAGEGESLAADWLKALLAGTIEGGGGVSNGAGGAVLWLAPHAAVAAVDCGDTIVLADLHPNPAAPGHGLDAGQGLARLDPLSAVVRLTPAAAQGVLRTHRLALLGQTVGIVDAVLERSRRYAIERAQFGRPIASFQAVAHRLAAIKVALDSGRSSLARLVALTEGGDFETADALTDAFAYALPEAARRSVEDAIQVHGGIGFTWEYGLHLWYRRALAIQSMLGGHRGSARRAGSRYIAQRRALSPSTTPANMKGVRI
jgi:alkylation response protein AidB-like acyl-CoA dehydrogenase